jgi:hypothetical protein
MMRYSFPLKDKEDLMATAKSYKPNQLYAVPLADLQEDANQPRKYLDPHALEASGKKVTAMDFNALTGDDRPLVIRAMTDLKNTMENALSKAPQ